MKHLIILISQTKSNLTERELIGTWLINEIKVNGLVKTDFKPELQDAIILENIIAEIPTKTTLMSF